MKSLYFTVFFLIALSSCSIYNRIVEINDSYKGIKGLRIDQNPYACSAEKTGTVFGAKQSYPFTSCFQYEETKQQRPDIFVDFRLNTPVSADQLDSVVYFNLDGEKIKLVAGKSRHKDVQSYSATTSATSDSGKKSEQNDKPDGTNTLNVTSENGNYQIMNLRFMVPENLWISIAHATQIQYRLYQGKEGIDVKLNAAETTKLKSFFQQACAMRDAAFPAIPTTPPGLKKW